MSANLIKRPIYSSANSKLLFNTLFKLIEAIQAIRAIPAVGAIKTNKVLVRQLNALKRSDTATYGL